MCRRAPRQRSAASLLPEGLAQASAVPAAGPRQVDMRLPKCAKSSPCDKSVDVRLQPAPLTGSDIRACTSTIMNFAAFPCTFDSSKYQGVPGQTNNVCFSKSSANLTTDGYNNVYYGVLPGALCPGLTLGGPQQAIISQLLLTVEFRLAKGIQYDRTFVLQLGNAVAAFGITTEPSGSRAEKTWSVTNDVTHLQSYIKPGMPVRFSVDNVLTDTYNVPLWARVQLRAAYTQPPAPPPTPSSISSAATLNSPPPAATARALPASVPDEIIPLSATPHLPIGSPTLVWLEGTGEDSPSWPSVAFKLPRSVSSGLSGPLYRAQLQVVPKANACEEFWAMLPKGTTCNDNKPTGNPYRELRVYVNGQLAGFSPIAYTMYTGGMDPALWSAIVAHKTHQLPVYTFDISPWVGVLNAGPAAAGADAHSITVEIVGAAGSNWAVANTLLLWRAAAAAGSVAQAVPAPEPVKVTASLALLAPVTSRCKGEDTKVAGDCRVDLRSRSLTAFSVVRVLGVEYTASVSYTTMRYNNTITFDNVSGRLKWWQETRHATAWKMAASGTVAPPSPSAALLQDGGSSIDSTVITQDAREIVWLNAGSTDDLVLQFSWNETLAAPSVLRSLPDLPGSHQAVWTGWQRHYQRANILEVCNVTTPSHKVFLKANEQWLSPALPADYVAADEGPRLLLVPPQQDKQEQQAAANRCIVWRASAGYCPTALLQKKQSRCAL